MPIKTGQIMMWSFRPQQISLLLVLIISLASLVHSTAAPTKLPSYTITDLGTLGGLESHATRMNDAGQIVGWSQTKAGLNHAFLYTNSKMIDLGCLPNYQESQAAGINNHGHVVGWVVTQGQEFNTAFIYKNGKMEGVNFSDASERHTRAGFINDRDQILGYSDAPHVTSKVYLSQNKIAKIMTISGYDEIWLACINNQGLLVGRANTNQKRGNFAFIMTGAKPQRIPPFGEFEYTTPQGCNDLGQVVGFCDRLTRRAFVFKNGKTVALETIAGTNSEAYSINNKGMIVGRTAKDGENMRAAVWINRHCYDLNQLVSPHSGWLLRDAFGINNQGVIMGNGIIHGHIHAFALHPN